MENQKIKYYHFSYTLRTVYQMEAQIIKYCHFIYTSNFTKLKNKMESCSRATNLVKNFSR